MGDKNGGEVERKKWGVLGRTEGEKQKRKQQKIVWANKKNLHFRRRQKKKKDGRKKAFFSVFYRFLAFFSVKKR